VSLIRRMVTPSAGQRSWNPTLVSDTIAATRGASSYAGQTVTVDTAMRLPAFWACVRLLASTISALPLDTYRDDPGLDAVEIAPPPLIETPSNLVHRDGWLYQIMVSLLTAGNAYGIVTDTDRGYATRIEIVSPADIVAEQTSPLAPPTWRYRGEPVDSSLIWHVPAWLVPGSPIGLSPVAYARQALGIGLAAEEYAARWYGDGGHPTQALASDQPITQEQAEAAKQRYLRSVGTGREPVVLGGGLKPISLQIAPEDAQLLESEQFTVGQICRLLGVPPEMVGAAADGGSSVTYANREQRARDFLVYGVQGWLVRLETSISALLPPGQVVRFDVDDLLRADMASRYAAYRTGIDGGWLTVNEVRAEEHLPPVAGGDVAASRPAPTPIMEPDL